MPVIMCRGINYGNLIRDGGNGRAQLGDETRDNCDSRTYWDEWVYRCAAFNGPPSFNATSMERMSASFLFLSLSAVGLFAIVKLQLRGYG